MARAKHQRKEYDPAVVAHRREMVHNLNAQGMKPHAIMRFIRNQPDLSHLLDGYSNPYQIILTDLKKPRSYIRRHNVDGEATEVALNEVVERLDRTYAEMWNAYEKRMELLGVPDDICLKYLDAAQQAAMAKANMMGVSSQGEPSEDKHGNSYTQQNVFLGESAQDFLKQVQQAGRVINGGYIDGEATVLPSGGEDSNNAEVYE